MNKHSFIGGKSKGKTLSDVAQMHGMTTDELRPQYKKGTEHELEHTTSVVIARRIALDHLVEFPDYYDRLDKIEKMKKGAVVEKTMTFNDMVLYYERKGNWLFAKGNFYAWLYDQDGAGKKVETGEYDFIMFPPMGKGSPFSEKYVPPLLMVWQKSYQKNYKGSEHLLGIVKGFYDEDKNQLIIDMMTSNPKFRRKGINAHIIKQLRTEFGVTQDNVIFDKPTKEGKLFESSKKYKEGGVIDFVSSKSLIVKIGNDSYKIQYQKDEIGSTEKNVWFANIIAKNEIEVKGRLCYADEYVAVIHGMNLNDVTDEIMDFYKSNDLYLIIQDEYGKVTETRHIESNDSDIFAKGGRTIAQTPAPKSDRVSGSKTNPKGSASDSYLGKSIKFNDALTKAIQNKVDEYNEKHPSDKVSLATAKAVVRRGFGAYSKSHRPTITGGAPNSRQAWGLARLNKFLIKKSGGKVKSAYIQDDDLL
jgi:hypothetical protein